MKESIIAIILGGLLGVAFWSGLAVAVTSGYTRVEILEQTVAAQEQRIGALTKNTERAMDIIRLHDDRLERLEHAAAMNQFICPLPQMVFEEYTVNVNGERFPAVRCIWPE